MADVKIQSESKSSDSQPLVVDNQPPPPSQPLVEEEDNQPKTSPTPPPHWMRYPPPVLMPHQMMYAPPLPPLFSPYHQYPNHHHSRGNNNNKHQNASNGENKTIWVGDLHHWMDEAYLNSSFASDGGEIVSLKVIRNKHNGLSEGYGFVEFDSHDVADKVLQEFNGATMPNTDQPFRLNWASFSTGEKRLENNGPDLSIFVGDLAPDVSDTLLHEMFSEKYPSVKAAKVVLDANTGRSKGYGFVRFGDENERTKAMTEMNGVKCSSRAMRIGPATPRKTTGYQQQGGFMLNGALMRHEGDTLNTTIFVGGLDSSVTDDDLRQPFSEFGEIVSVKIPVGKGCGFVQFVNRPDAEEALEKLNGTVIGKQTVRLSWGRNPANKQPRDKYGNQWVAPYYGGQYYNGYGYMVPQLDPRMYPATPYGGYPMYGGHQQQVS
ncbi:RNA recognition motif domain [Arabidopsis thaliana x Arabidopsis arenosa]|uniref:RNA recognition motif domain n=1 Tax=Arabidopsis thaliana x Arabidopsis arenosa TaxID=1240361 RepID=A0A8T2C2Q3_9BRAS|nr:RNA recognition motif domain [Arabidopsis thaliana x Arabidopsis arenosa]